MSSGWHAWKPTFRSWSKKESSASERNSTWRQPYLQESASHTPGEWPGRGVVNWISTEAFGADATASNNVDVSAMDGLYGVWQDEKGTRYELSRNTATESIDVQTIRTSGKIYWSPNLIQMLANADASYVVWGRGDHGSQYVGEIPKANGMLIWKRRKDGRTFRWTRCHSNFTATSQRLDLESANACTARWRHSLSNFAACSEEGLQLDCVPCKSTQPVCHDLLSSQCLWEEAVQFMSPFDIHFTQSSIAEKFKKGTALLTTLKLMLCLPASRVQNLGSWAILDVTWYNDRYYVAGSFNRRLAVFRLFALAHVFAGRQKSSCLIRVRNCKSAGLVSRGFQHKLTTACEGNVIRVRCQPSAKVGKALADTTWEAALDIVFCFVQRVTLSQCTMLQRHDAHLDQRVGSGSLTPNTTHQALLVNPLPFISHTSDAHKGQCVESVSLFTKPTHQALLIQLAAFPKKALPRALQGLLMITASSEVGSVDSMDCSIRDNVSICSGHSVKNLSDVIEVQRSVSIQRMLAMIAQGPPPYNPPSSKAIAAPAHRELPKESRATACSLLDTDLCAWQAHSCFAESSVAQIAERESAKVSDDSFDPRSTHREPPNGFSTAACSLLDADLAQADPCGDVHLKRGPCCELSLVSETAPFEGTSCNFWSEHAAAIQSAQSCVAQTAVQDSEEVSDDSSDDHSTQREPPNEFSTAVFSLLDADLVQAHLCGDTSLKRGEGCELCPASEATFFKGTKCNSWREHFAALRSSQICVAQTAVRDGHEVSDDSSDGDSVMNELVTGLAHVLGKSPQENSHEVATQVSEGHLVTLLQDLQDDPHDDSVMNGLVTDLTHVLGKPPQDNSHEVATQVSEGHLVTLLQNLQDDPYDAALCKNKEAHNDANQISEGYLVSLLHHNLTE